MAEYYFALLGDDHGYPFHEQWLALAHRLNDIIGSDSWVWGGRGFSTATVILTGEEAQAKLALVKMFLSEILIEDGLLPLDDIHGKVERRY